MFNASKNDHESLEAAIQLEAPWLTPYVHAMDTTRDPNHHDPLDDQLYGHLLRKAKQETSWRSFLKHTTRLRNRERLEYPTCQQHSNPQHC